MLHKTIKTLAALVLGATMFAACGKDNYDNEAFIGKWTSTAQSYEITIGGQEYLPEGRLCMEFTDDKVWISDSRIDCVAVWYSYTLSEKEGKQLLEVKGDAGCFAGRVFVVKELTNDKLVLAPYSTSIDWDFRYIMKRSE